LLERLLQLLLWLLWLLLLLEARPRQRQALHSALHPSLLWLLLLRCLRSLTCHHHPTQHLLATCNCWSCTLRLL
jgi:hypothetical protein